MLKKHKGFEDLATLGDLDEGRPTLGEFTPVKSFRALIHIGIRDYLGEKLGSVVNTFLYESGRDIGRELVKKKVIGGANSIEDAIELMEEFFEEEKIGKMSFIGQEGAITRIRIDECLSCSGMNDVGEALCYFEAGLITGIIKNLLDMKVIVKERKCWGMGDKTCEFTIENLEYEA